MIYLNYILNYINYNNVLLKKMFLLFVNFSIIFFDIFKNRDLNFSFRIEASKTKAENKELEFLVFY